MGDKSSPDGDLEKLTDFELADRIRGHVPTAGGASVTFLREAARRLESRTDAAYRVASVRLVSKANPTQFDGVLEDGDAFFVRYREHQITVYVDDHLIHFDEIPDAPLPDRITFAEAKRLLREVLEFPDSFKVGD